LHNLIAWTLGCILSPFLYGLESCKQGPVKGVCRALRIAKDLTKSTNRLMIQLISAKIKTVNEGIHLGNVEILSSSHTFGVFPKIRLL
jgi:hypothetical protein